MATASQRSSAWLLLTVSGLLLAVAWALASPVGASPDEPTHISYAWGTVTGQTLGGEHLVTIPNQYAVGAHMVTIPGGATVTRIQVPQKLLQYPPPSCYSFKAGNPTTQCSPIPADNEQNVTQDSNMTRYPPLFYGVEGLVLRAGAAVDLSGPRVLYGARLAAAVLSWLAVAFGVFLLSRRFPARIVLLATLLGLPATAWFLAASVNPNGLEVTSAFLLAVGVLSVRVDLVAGVRSVAAVLAVPLGTLLLAWTRPVSWMWASLILGLLLVPTGQPDGEPWRRRLPVRSLGATALAATIVVLTSSIAWFGYALQIRAPGSVNIPNWTALNPVGRIVVLLFHSGTIVTEQIGTFGWLDTPLPTVALFAWLLIAGVAVAAWSVGRNILVPRWYVGVVLGLGYLVALLDEYRGAWGWQGRYLLAVTAAVCVFAVPGLVKGLEGWTASRRAVPWMLTLLMAVNALSVVWFLFRNVYGVKSFGRRLPAAPLPVGAPAWTPPLGQGVVLALVALALACGVVAVWTLRPVPPAMSGRPRADRITLDHSRGGSPRQAPTDQVTSFQHDGAGKPGASHARAGVVDGL